MNKPNFSDDGLFDDDDDDLFLSAPGAPTDGGPVCQGCGCSEFDPCEGGCVWATPELCSRCV